MRSFELATQEKFSYLLLDWCPRSEKSYQLRTNILPGESTIVYHPIKWNKTRNTIWFCFLMDVPKQQFAHLLKIMTKEQLQTIIEIICNVVQGVCTISEANKSILSKHKHLIRRLITKRSTFYTLVLFMPWGRCGMVLFCTTLSNF